MSEQIKKAIKWHENAMTSSDFEKQMIDITLQALQSELDRQENRALTLSELKEMVGEPVYHSIYRWCVIKEIEKRLNLRTNKIEWQLRVCDDFWLCLENDGTFYKHKPTEGVGR